MRCSIILVINELPAGPVAVVDSRHQVLVSSGNTSTVEDRSASKWIKTWQVHLPGMVLNIPCTYN